VKSSNIFLSSDAFQFYAAILIAFFVYLLGLRAYHKQKSHEQLRERYLFSGLDLWAAHCDYALGVFRRNWALTLRIMKEYREFDTNAEIDDFFDKFEELDYERFQISPSARIQSLIDSTVFWNAYQNIFALVTNANNEMKSDFGSGLRRMANEEEHPRKAEFLQEALNMSDELDEKAKINYELVSLVFQLSELLARTNYSINDMGVFSKRQDVIDRVVKMQDRVGNEEDAA